MPDLFSTFQRNKIKNLYADMFDTYSKECRLYYPPLISNCSSCLSLVSNSFQGNANVHGTNIDNFDNCSYCGGTGKIEQEVTETIQLICNWQPKNFKNLFLNVNINQAMLLTKGKMKDFEKVRRSIYMMVQPKLEVLLNNKYKLSSEGSDQYCLIQDEWFFQLWESA